MDCEEEKRMTQNFEAVTGIKPAGLVATAEPERKLTRAEVVAALEAKARALNGCAIKSGIADEKQGLFFQVAVMREAVRLLTA
jgi:hypothetical protein